MTRTKLALGYSIPTRSTQRLALPGVLMGLISDCLPTGSSGVDGQIKAQRQAPPLSWAGPPSTTIRPKTETLLTIYTWAKRQGRLSGWEVVERQRGKGLSPASLKTTVQAMVS